MSTATVKHSTRIIISDPAGQHVQTYTIGLFLRCVDIVSWGTGRASGLQEHLVRATPKGPKALLSKTSDGGPGVTRSNLTEVERNIY